MLLQQSAGQVLVSFAVDISRGTLILVTASVFWKLFGCGFLFLVVKKDQFVLRTCN